ncbi:MAG: hypothetical protein QM778_34380 [Myxococcales bacterium]
MTRAFAFELDAFIQACRVALLDGSPEKAMREVVARAVSEPAAVLRALGEPVRAGLVPLHRSEELTIMNVVWGPGMTVRPHDHRMWATIGIYTGREDNIFWRRIEDEQSGKVEARGARSLSAGDCVTLGREIIHSVTNPIPRLSGAIHVYGGNLAAVARSEWDPESLLERPYDSERTARDFESANERR